MEPLMMLCGTTAGKHCLRFIRVRQLSQVLEDLARNQKVNNGVKGRN
jgi:hypothetical protein